jgi:hypothetical protein
MPKRTSERSGISLRWWAFSTVVIAFTGAIGLAFVLTQLYPTPTTQWLFFVLLFITFGAGVIPFSAYLNYRFAARRWRTQDRYRLLRHGLESGLLVVIVVYLQFIQTLDWIVAAVLVGVFMLMETFFLTRA